MIIQAYKSKITGEVFEDLNKYRSHHRTALIHKKYKRLYTDRRLKFAADGRKQFAAEIVHFRETVCNISDIEKWVINNSTRLAKHFDMEVIDRDGKLVHYAITEFMLYVSPRSEVSNSHSAPLNGGVTNWGNTFHDRPTSYPGWYGKFKFKYIGNIDEFPSEILKRIGIFSGSGSGGGGGYQGVVNLFDADWPALKMYRTLTV